MDNPIVSICIPTSDESHNVAETIDSVLAQTHTNLEVHVVDRTSGTTVKRVIERYDDSRIKLSIEDSQNQADHWTSAVKATTGDFVKLMVPGDTLDPNCIETQVAALRTPENSQAVMTACRRTIVDPAGNVLIKSRGLGGMNGLTSGNDIIRKTVRSGTNPIGEPAAVLIRGEIFRACLPWDDSLDYMIDIDMWIRITHQGPLVALPQTLTTYCIPAGVWNGAQTSKQRGQAVEFIKRLQQRHPQLVSSTDVKIGAAQAALLAQGRRATYWYIDRKK